MANEIQHRHDATGDALYCTIRNLSNQYWDVANTNWETLVPASWGDYDLTLPETPAASYVHEENFPVGITDAGHYTVDVFEMVGSLPAITDTLLATYSIEWNGTARIDLIDAQVGVVAGFPTANVATSGVAVNGTVDAGTYASTALRDNAYWQVSPVAGGLTVEPKFLLGTAQRVSHVMVNGHWDALAARKLNCYAYNYITTAWDQLTDDGNRMNHATSDQDYGPWVLLTAHQKAADGEVHLRFASTSITAGDNLYLDQVLVYSVAIGGGFSLADIAAAVSAHDVSLHSDHNALGFRVSQVVIDEYAITTPTSTTVFTCSSLPAVTDFYKYHRIRIHDVTNSRYMDSWILSMTDAGVVTLGKAVPVAPDASSEMYVLAGLASPVLETMLDDVDSTGTETITVAKAIEILLAIAGGDASYNSTTRVWTVKGRDDTTSLWTVRESATVYGTRDLSTKV